MARPVHGGPPRPLAFPAARQPGSDRWRSGSGLPLGHLAAVQLYTTNADPLIEGKGHSPLCRHAIALDLLAWMPMLALTGDTRRWEPTRLRLRRFCAAAQLVNTGRRRWLRFTAGWPWTDAITTAMRRLQALPNPG